MGATRVMKVLERRGLNLGIEKQQSDIVVNRLDIGRWIVQTESGDHPVLQI